MPRMMAPDGTLGMVPDDKVSDAEAAGFRVMNEAKLQHMHNRLFFAQKFFEKAHPKVTVMKLPRGRGRW